MEAEGDGDWGLLLACILVALAVALTAALLT